eukprot:COSAG02_NODE_130_length_34758_cov_80.817767_10_plen_119_part_00
MVVLWVCCWQPGHACSLLFSTRAARRVWPSLHTTDAGLAHVFHSVQKCYVIFTVVFTVTLHNNSMAFIEVLGSPLVEFLDHGRAESRKKKFGMKLQFSADFHGIFDIFMEFSTYLHTE